MQVYTPPLGVSTVLHLLYVQCILQESLEEYRQPSYYLHEVAVPCLYEAEIIHEPLSGGAYTLKE